MTVPVLTILALLPIVAGAVVMFLKGATARYFGLAVSLVTFVVGLAAFLAASGGTDLSEKHQWISSIGAWYALSSDPLSMTMVLLTVALVPVVLGAEWRIGRTGDAWAGGADTGDPSQLPGSIFFGLALMLEGLAIYCFVAADVLLFYLFFEATLLPMYFLISGWGGARRRAAALKFLIYSLVGGLIMLVAVIGLGVHSGASGHTTFLLADLVRMNFDGAIGRYLFIGFFIAFAIKAPMVPVHTWLPDAAEQATPGSSVLLVGILDKIGTFGMLRLCLGLFPQASAWATPVVLALAVISILWGAVMAATSHHLMRLVSYTSVSHFGFMVLGIFALTTPSITGSIFYMFNHGFATAALFLVLGFLVRRRGSADIKDFGGVQAGAPVLAGLFLVSGLATLGLPGTSSFASEFLVLAGAWGRHPVYVAVATIGMVGAAVYVLRAYRRTMTGPIDEGTPPVRTDLGGREKFVLAPLIIVLLVFGFFPKPMLDVIEPAARATMSQLNMTDPQPVVKEGVK